jgi:hypothetical protein
MTARIVLNHSTHVPTLIVALEAVARAAGPRISTLVPGRLSKCRGHTPLLTLAVTVPTRGGHRILARAGSLVQEVFATTPLDSAQLQEVLDAAVPRSKTARRDEGLR